MDDLISRQAAIEALKRAEALTRAFGYHFVIDTIRELPPAQPEPAIPLSWIENNIAWLKSLDNAFSALTAGQISAMVNKWKDEQNERSN